MNSMEGRATEEAARRVRALAQKMRADGWLNPRQWSPTEVGEVLRGRVVRTIAKVDPWSDFMDTTVCAPEPNWKEAPTVVIMPEQETDPVVVDKVRFLGRDPQPGDVAYIEVASWDPVILVGAFVPSDPSTDVEALEEGAHLEEEAHLYGY